MGIFKRVMGEGVRGVREGELNAIGVGVGL